MTAWQWADGVQPHSRVDSASRIHISDAAAATRLAKAITYRFAKLNRGDAPIVLLCIGTDRSTGDALGPLVGSKVQPWANDRFHVYGTLDQPVHATNLSKTMEMIDVKHPEATILCVDACLGRAESVGYMSVKEGPLLPGTGVNKQLPSVGHFHIVGIVNVAGFMEYFVLQNTRLNLVMQMADTIASAIRFWQKADGRWVGSSETELLDPVL